MSPHNLSLFTHRALSHPRVERRGILNGQDFELNLKTGAPTFPDPAQGAA